MVRFIFICICVSLCYFNNSNTQILDFNYDFGTYQYVLSQDDYDDALLKKSERILLDLLNKYPENASRDKAAILKSKIDYSIDNQIIAYHNLNEFIKNRANSPFIPYAYFMRGLIAFELNRYIDAESNFEAASIFAESDIEDRDSLTYSQIAHLASFWNGVALHKQGKSLDALQPFSKTAFKYEKYELSDDALYNIACIYELNHKYDSAIANFRLNTQKHPYRNTALASYIGESRNLLAIRQPVSSLIALKQAENIIININRNDSISKKYETQNVKDNVIELIQYLKGESYNIAGKYQEGANVFSNFLETYSESEYIDLILLSYGYSLLNLNKNELALQQFQRILASNKEKDVENNNQLKILPLAQLYKAIALKRGGRAEEAKNELLNLTSQPSYPLLGNALLETGQIYYEEKDFESAIKTLERAAIETQDGRIMVRINLLLASAYMEKGINDRAIREYKKVLQIAESSNDIVMPKRNWYLSEANLKLGISLINANKSAEAIRYLQNFISENKNDNRVDEATFWLAEAFYKNDLLKNSIDNYNKVLNNYPSSMRREESLYGVGWSYFKLRNFDQSSKSFEQLVKEFPKSKYAVEVLTRQADGYYLNKNFRQAANYYERAAKMAPGTEEGHYASYQMANALYRLGSNEQAITSLLNFVRQYNKSKFAPTALYLVGWIRFQEKKYQEAIDNFEFLINSYSQSTLIPRAYYAIGDCFYNASNYESAILNYRKVIESYPGSDLAPEAIKSIQFALIALGREGEAIDIANKYVDSNPESPFAPAFQKKIGEMFYQGQKYNDAVTEFQKFIEKHPQDENTPEVLFMMAKSHINLNNPEKAKDIFNKIQQFYPKSEWAQTALLENALLNLETANVTTADSLFQSLAKLYPETDYAAQSYFERAVIKYRLGDTTTSLNLFREAHNRYKTSDWGDQSIYRIAMHYRNIENYDSARYYFEIIANIDENPKISSEARYRIGELYFRDKNYEKAIENFLIIKNKFEGYEDWYSLALINLGESYEKLENFDEARNIYTILEVLRPNDDFGKTAKSRLKRFKKN